MTIIATIIVLGVLIFVHELGHFWAAKSVGVRVERFSIGLGPRVWGHRSGETEYVLSAIPLGGYVKMGGMDDEVMEAIEGGKTEGEAAAGGPAAGDPATGDPPPPRDRSRDFDAKPVWARAWVISAGVIMNMLFAFFAYTAVAAGWGSVEPDTLRLGEVRTELLPAGTEGIVAIPSGAEIIQVGDRTPRHWGYIRRALLELPAGPVTIRWAFAEGTVPSAADPVEATPPAADPAEAAPTAADPAEATPPAADPAEAAPAPAGQAAAPPPASGEVTIVLPDDEEARWTLSAALLAWTDPIVQDVLPASPADRTGIQRGDRIVAVDGEPIRVWSEFSRMVRARPEQQTELTLERAGGLMTRTITPDAQRVRDAATGEFRDIGHVGISVVWTDIAYTRMNPADAVSYGARETWAVTGLILGFLRDLFTGQMSPRNLGSIVTIGEMSGQAAAEGIPVFLRFMALFSVNLAILNLLPIPVLDGGHLVFLGIEAVRGRPLSVEQRMRWSQVGFVVLIGIMALALGNDFLRLFGL